MREIVVFRFGRVDELEERSNLEVSGSGILQVSGKDVLFSRLGKLWNASHFSAIADSWSVKKELAARKGRAGWTGHPMFGIREGLN